MTDETKNKQTYLVQLKLPAVGIEHPYDNPEKPITSVEEYINDHQQFLTETQRPWFTQIINRFFEWIAEQNLHPTIDENVQVSFYHGTLILNCEPATAEIMKSYPAVIEVREFIL